jgi:hypothetical protein
MGKPIKENKIIEGELFFRSMQIDVALGIPAIVKMAYDKTDMSLQESEMVGKQVMKAIREAMVPGSVVGIFCKSLVELDVTTVALDFIFKEPFLDCIKDGTLVLLKDKSSRSHLEFSNNSAIYATVEPGGKL